jgi:ABC-type dipeptide/oligopeptide/nickel transport system permease subunit
MLEVLRTDYIKFARARGLPDRAVYFGHALKNTLVPVITITGLQLGSLIAFAIITETVFQWPGMGFLFIQAVQFADIPVMAAYLCLIALIFVVINLVVDLLYFAVDPRLRIERRPRATEGTNPGMAMKSPPHARRPRRAGPLLDGDVWYSFRNSPVAIVAAVIALLCVVCAVFAPWLAPHNPFDLATLEPVRRAPAAGLAAEGGNHALPAGHRRPGPRHPLGADVRRPHLAVRGLASVLLSVVWASAWAAVGLRRRQGRRLHHARVRRDAVVPGHPDRAADRRRGPRDVPERARHAGLRRADLAIALTGWVQYARTVRGSTLVERNKEYVQAARVIGVPPHASCAPRAAQRDGAGAGAGHHPGGGGHPHRGHAVLPGRRRAADQPSLGTLIRIGNDFLFSGEWWITIFPGADAGADRAEREPAGRLAARRAQPAPALKHA